MKDEGSTRCLLIILPPHPSSICHTTVSLMVEGLILDVAGRCGNRDALRAGREQVAGHADLERHAHAHGDGCLAGEVRAADVFLSATVSVMAALS